MIDNLHLWTFTEHLHLWMLIVLWGYTYSLEVNREAEDGWNNTISESDNLTRPIKICVLKMMRAKYRCISCTESLSPQSHFPLLPHIFVLGKPSKWKLKFWESLYKNISQRRSSLFSFFTFLRTFLQQNSYFENLLDSVNSEANNKILSSLANVIPIIIVLFLHSILVSIVI